MLRAKAMTIGQLARRTNVSIKTLREYERLGLIYTLGRSESNYRLFDESALWCLNLIRSLRALGLTMKEIHELATIYVQQPEEPMGPQVHEKLHQALTRIDAQTAQLQAVRQRNLDIQVSHTAGLSGEAALDLFAADPRRQKPIPLDSSPGVRL